MWLIRAALRRPVTIVIAVVAVALSAVFAVSRMRADIFPDLNLPVIYVAQPYGGLSPAQIEGYITYYYEYHFLYINGIESVESKSIQNTALRLTVRDELARIPSLRDLQFGQTLDYQRFKST
jgi:multidrug efflux pump subunit AcrB